MNALHIAFNGGMGFEPQGGEKLSPLSLGLGLESTPFASVITHPTDSSVVGIKNESNSIWKAVTASGPRDVAPGQTLKLADGTRIDFGFAQATVTDAVVVQSPSPGQNLVSGWQPPTVSTTPTPKPFTAINPITPMHQPIVPSLNSVQQQSGGAVSLTSDEERVLLWEKGDFFEVLSGSISFTSSRQFKMVAAENATLHTEVSFFFQSNDPRWPTSEWFMLTPAQIPNGPALLVLYRRGNTANAWGIVSMVNRAWTHVIPLDSISLAKGSSRSKTLGKQFWLRFGIALIIILVAEMLTCGLATFVLPIIGIWPDGRRWIKKTLGLQENERTALEIGDTARAFMFRLANEADRYWQGSGGSSGSKL